MFSVRTPRARGAQCPVGSSVHTVCLGVTRQGASKFNQPLSFMTSSVTDMYYMFSVRDPARVLCPVSSRFLRARCVHRHTAPTRPRTTHPRVALHVLWCDSAGRVGVQPAAEPRHLQRYGHGEHASGAHPHARAMPSAQSVPPCMLRAPPPHPHASSHHPPPCRPPRASV
eukprot:scaffold93795_cov42-Phaeocystis_antarctica.AAC.1